jgi:DNA-directed RNA polymerase specialized sigma24 family protein
MAKLGAKRGRGQTRQMVLRYKAQGFTQSEIARLCGISRQAVHMHLMDAAVENERATERLRQKVKDYSAKGLNPSEIARLLDISRTAVMTHLALEEEAS